MASRCDYKIILERPVGYGLVQCDVVAYEGEITTETESMHNSEGISEDVSVTRYRRTGILVSRTSIGDIPIATKDATLNAWLDSVRSGRTAISEQAL